MPEFDQEQIVQIRALIEKSSADIKERRGGLRRFIDENPFPATLGGLVIAVGVTFAVIKALDDRVDERLDDMAPKYVSEAVSLATENVDNAVERAFEASIALLGDSTALQRDLQISSERMNDSLQDEIARAKAAWGSANSLITEIETRAEQVATLADAIKLDELEARIDTALLAPEFRDLVAARVFPNGSVVAFDLATGCPTDWVPFEGAGGRMLIGAGENDNVDIDGAELKEYDFAEPGGAEEVTLTEAQMPKHSHVQVWGQSAGRLGTPASGNSVAGYKGHPMQRTLPEGGSQPHPNMPPYIALYFCKKD